MSLKPGSEMMESPSDTKGLSNSLDTLRPQGRPGVLQPSYIQDRLEAKDTREENGHPEDDRSLTDVSNREDLALCSPPRTENEVQEDFIINGFTFSVCGHFYCALINTNNNCRRLIFMLLELKRICQ